MLQRRTRGQKTIVQPPRLSTVLEVLAVLEPFVPVILSRPELEQANAALLDIVNTTAATKLSNRLDIGSPPFRKPGTCRGETIADSPARDKREAPPADASVALRRGTGHIPWVRKNFAAVRQNLISPHPPCGSCYIPIRRIFKK